jgi:hypothetical protein
MDIHLEKTCYINYRILTMKKLMFSGSLIIFPFLRVILGLVSVILVELQLKSE